MRTHKERWILLGVVLLLVFVGLPWALVVHFTSAEADPLFVESNLNALAEEAFRLVEAHEGTRFHQKPTVLALTMKERMRLHRAELRTWFRERDPEASESQVSERVEDSIRELPRWILGEYSASTHTIVLFRKRIRCFLLLSGYLEEAEPIVLRQLLVHEAVHALDEDQHRRVTRLGELQEAGEGVVFEAVIEGHAEYVTGVIAHQTEAWSIFEAWQASYVGQEDETAFKYYWGHQFFLHVAGRNRPDFIARVFRSPPTTREEILHPDTYRLGD